MERTATGRAEDEVIRAAHDWDRAMVTNDPDLIGAFMADEWVIIGPDGTVGDRARFLDLVRSGALTHGVMESHDMSVRVYGETAVVVARGVSGGRYLEQPFYLVERVTCVFVLRERRWQCVLTHLSSIT